MRLFATCARGLEDVSAAEVAELVGACGDAAPGRVSFAATWPQVARLHVRARTLHKVHLLLARAEVHDLDEVAAAARGVDWARHIAPTQRFAVRPDRAGAHAFTSLDVGRVVGAEVERGAASQGQGPRVDLDAPDVEVSARLRDRELVLGLNLTGESLHKRGYRVYQHPAPLRPSLAAALLRWGAYEPARGLWDPMCGSATLPIEAALIARGLAPNPQRPFLMERLRGFPAGVLEEARAEPAGGASPGAPIAGSERYEKHLLGGAANARAAGVWDAMTLRVLDATAALPQDLDFRPGLVALNPPFGLRIASQRAVQRLYRAFLRRVPGFGAARMVVLAGNPWFERAAAEVGMAPAEARAVMVGQLPARALRFELSGAS